MLEVSDLCKGFQDESRLGRVKAVDHVSFVVKEGSFFTMLGPSGCGKTTTLRCIAGLERPDSGDISVNSRVLYSSAMGMFVSANQRNLGMVFQSYAIWPHMNVFDNVAFPLRVGARRRTGKREVKQRVERTLDVVGLGHLAGRYATKLSGGQQQRLALAGARVIGLSVFLGGEPLSNLDAKLRESLRFELKRLQREQGITTVYVTHDQSEALSMSNSVAVMNEGRISQIGDPFSIYLNPENPFVADFVGSPNFIEGVLVGRQGDGWTVRTPNGPIVVSAAMGVSENDRCMVSIRPEHIEVLGDGSESGTNCFSGEVAARLFTGESMVYRVTLPHGELNCRTPAALRYSTGKPVTLHL